MKCPKCKCSMSTKEAATDLTYNAPLPIHHDEEGVPQGFILREVTKPVCGACIREATGRKYTLA